MSMAGTAANPSPLAQDGAAEALHIESLHKKFGDLHVLKGVSLSARDGDVIAIIGGSGSGKSTLLRCINCLENPTSGVIRVNGEQIRLKADSHGHTVPADRRQIERIRSRLGMVFQSFNLWSHLTLLENVIEVPVHVLGVKRDKAVAEAETLLDRVGLAEKRDVLKVIGDLAREGRTMVLVTHEMKFAREVATHVVYLYNGLVEEEGPPEEIFGAPKSERLKQFIRSIG